MLINRIVADETRTLHVDAANLVPLTLEERRQMMPDAAAGSSHKNPLHHVRDYSARVDRNLITMKRSLLARSLEGD